MELIQVPTIPKYRDPLHILLQFIAEEAPNCDMVLVHDNDLAELHGVYDGTPIELLQPDAMLRHLRSAQLKIHEVPFGPDLSSANNGGSADTETVRIATLSNFLGELSSPSTSSSTQSRYDVKTLSPRIGRLERFVKFLFRSLNATDAIVVNTPPTRRGRISYPLTNVPRRWSPRQSGGTQGGDNPPEFTPST